MLVTDTDRQTDRLTDRHGLKYNPPLERQAKNSISNTVHTNPRKSCFTNSNNHEHIKPNTDTLLVQLNKLWDALPINTIWAQKPAQW